jgi:hypothetical protein
MDRTAISPDVRFQFSINDLSLDRNRCRRAAYRTAWTTDVERSIWLHRRFHDADPSIMKRVADDDDPGFVIKV